MAGHNGAAWTGDPRTNGRSSRGLALLSFCAGSMDAIAVFSLGGVFTSAMSGNTIILGLALGQGHLTTAAHTGMALLNYLIGVAATSALVAVFNRGLLWALILEALLLVLFTATWLSFDTPHGSASVYGLIALSAIAMGLQGGIGRAVGAPGIMTVIFTSTYTAIVGSIVERAIARSRPLLTPLALGQLRALLAYLCGALIAAVCTKHSHAFLPLLPLATIILFLIGLQRRWVCFH
ncbi:YoaK family protein [Stenotrophomonas geniculata]